MTWAACLLGSFVYLHWGWRLFCRFRDLHNLPFLSGLDGLALSGFDFERGTRLRTRERTHARRERHAMVWRGMVVLLL